MKNVGNVPVAIVVPDRDNAGWLYGTKVVHVEWFCPICNGPMGSPELQSFCEDGEFYSVHVWDNPCGHVAKYVDLKQVQEEETT